MDVHYGLFHVWGLEKLKPYDWSCIFLYKASNRVFKTLMEFIQKYWPQLGALMAVIVTFITMKVDITVLKEKVKTLFQLINKDK